MSNSKLLPLALLYIGGDSIQGATRFQKLVFLAQEETNLDDIFEFEPDKYGPFSAELAQTLDVLEQNGFIKKDVETNISGQERYDYRLTPRGHNAASNMVDDQKYEKLLEEGKKIKERHNRKSLDTLLKYVYRKYPDMTKETELDLDKLFSERGPNSRSSPLY